jgi:hypothetical protein
MTLRLAALLLMLPIVASAADSSSLLGAYGSPYAIGIAGFAIALSIIFVKLMPNRPVQAFILSCLAVYFVAFLATGLRAGFGGGGEALFWNLLGAALFAPIWFPVCVIAHIVLRRKWLRNDDDQIGRR